MKRHRAEEVIKNVREGEAALGKGLLTWYILMHIDRYTDVGYTIGGGERCRRR